MKIGESFLHSEESAAHWLTPKQGLRPLRQKKGLNLDLIHTSVSSKCLVPV